MTTLTEAPHISTLDPNSPEFRAALATAGTVLKDIPWARVYSRHTHFPVPEGDVIFEEYDGVGRMQMHPVSREEAQERGLPSVWAVTPDGEPVPVRYADFTTHQRSGADVTSPEFTAALEAAARVFAQAGINSALEINAAGALFPVPDGMLTHEVTFEDCAQLMTLTMMTPEIASGDWAKAACWKFTPDGMPMVAGICQH